MSSALPIPPFQRLDPQCIVVELDSGDVQLRYDSDAEFKRDFSRLSEVLAELPSVKSDSPESTALIWEIAIHRLLLLNRGLLGPHQVFSKKDILEDPSVFRSALAELQRRHNDHERSISLLAAFFGLDLATANKLAGANDAFDHR